MRDDEFDDDDQLERSIRRDTGIPGSVRTAAVIWIIFGGLILINAVINLVMISAQGAAPAGGGPGGAPQAAPQVAGGMCGVLFAALFGGAFIFVGVQTTRGTATDTLGNAVGSIVFGVLNGGGGLIVIAAGMALGGMFGAIALIVGGISLVAGVALIVAGILAIVGRAGYKHWRELNR
jgi:hypothetical protein